MKKLSAIAWLIVLHAVAQQPRARWRYQREITPNASAPQVEQCVVLDADLFARSAPGLRDVRLLQDGREIAYALDESRDEAFERQLPAADAGRAMDNRAQYEVALMIPAVPLNGPGPAGNGDPWGRPAHPPGWFGGQALLPAHVPVERIRLMPGISGVETLHLRAAQQSDLGDAETLETTLTAAHPAADFTVGANLQTAADIRIDVNGAMGNVQAFVLEMRRREICYQPLSAAPLRLLFGNANARPVHYDYAAYFQPSATPVLAALGPRKTNPAYHEPTSKHFAVTRVQRLFLACFAAAAVFLLTVMPLLRRRFRN